ncbi:MAG: hypothetical protein ACYTEQ_01715 [Planctomycetota bacterium]|jgi:hypothetical protein
MVEKKGRLYYVYDSQGREVAGPFGCKHNAELRNKEVEYFERAAEYKRRRIARAKRDRPK